MFLLEHKGSNMKQDFTHDLSSIQFEHLDWSQKKRNESIQKIYQYVSTHAKVALDWYLIKKKSVRFWARFLRIWTIILTTFAGVIPLLSQIYKANPKLKIDPAWATIALVFAIMFIGLDTFFGFSKSWMRFITAHIKIKAFYEEFQLNWQISQARLKGEPPSDQQTIELLEFCKEFLSEINQIITEEAEEWKRNFQSALKKIDESTKSLKSN